MTKPTIQPNDFPVEAEKATVKTNSGEPLAKTKSEPLAEEIADRLNEQAYREEHDKWSP